MNRKKIALYSLLLSLGLGSLTGCQNNKNKDSDTFAIENYGISCESYFGADVIYDEIVKNATYNKKDNEIDFFSTVDEKKGIVAIVASGEVGISYDENLDGVWDSLYYIGLTKEEFCKRVFENCYDRISISELFSAKKQKNGNYQIKYIALNKEKNFCYGGEQLEYYIPSDLEEIKDGNYIFGVGEVSLERAQELFEEQINWWFYNVDEQINFMPNHSSNKVFTLRKRNV